MTTYQYEALDAGGKPQKGVVDASSSDDAIQQIRGQGFFPTSVREQKVKGGAAEGGKKGNKKKEAEEERKAAKAERKAAADEQAAEEDAAMSKPKAKDKKAKAAVRKQKSARSAAKRFKVTATGKLLRHRAGQAHLKRKKRPQQLQKIRRIGQCDQAELKTYQKMLLVVPKRG